MELSNLLAQLRKLAKVEVSETRTLHDETKVYLLVGSLPTFPTGSKPTWYPLVVRKGQSSVPEKEIETILRHFWQFQLNLFNDKNKNNTVRRSKAALRKSQ